MADKPNNNFNSKVKMHLACAKKSENQKEKECIAFKGDFAYATDNHILVRNRISEISGLEPFEIEALDGKFLHADFYKEMLKYDSIMIAEDGIECTKDDNKAFFYFSKFERYPDTERVLQLWLNHEPVSTSAINFDTKQLGRLTKALFKSDRCTARFKGTGNPIVYDSMEEDVSSVGLIMSLIKTDADS